jgi:hypothetical protein
VVQVAAHLRAHYLPEIPAEDGGVCGVREEGWAEVKGKRMTDQEINAAIAEACGWVDIFTATGKEEWLGTFAYEYEGKVMGFHQQLDDHAHEIPGYATDLNAMHEAGSVLSWAQTCLMGNWLEEICERPAKQADGSIDLRIAVKWRSTARQRAEAFLRTLGKWRETATPVTPVPAPALTVGELVDGD